MDNLMDTSTLELSHMKKVGLDWIGLDSTIKDLCRAVHYAVQNTPPLPTRYLYPSVHLVSAHAREQSGGETKVTKVSRAPSINHKPPPKLYRITTLSQPPSFFSNQLIRASLSSDSHSFCPSFNTNSTTT
jgi:hypothetical protein